MAVFGEMTEQNTLTMPAELREQLGLHHGDRVEYLQKDGETFLRVFPAKLSFEESRGMFPIFKTFEESQAWAREIRGRDEDEL